MAAAALNKAENYKFLIITITVRMAKSIYRLEFVRVGVCFDSVSEVGKGGDR